MSTHTEAEQTVASLLHWLEQGGAQLSKVRVVIQEGGERGVIARTDIAPKEVFIRIPRRFVVTSEDVRVSELGQLLESRARIDEERMYLSAFLLTERERGADSFWKPLVDVLPKSFPTIPFFFNERERSLLKGSYLEVLLESQRVTLEARHAHLCERIPGFDRFSYDAFVWSHFAACTRTFSMPQNGVMVAALVPLVDMINDARTWDSHWCLSEDGTHFEVHSISPVSGSQELRTSYGNKSNFRLLLQYGFVHEDNAHNEAMLLFQLPREEEPLAAEKRRLLRLSIPSERHSFKLTLTHDTELLKELFAFLRIAHADAEDLATIAAAPDPSHRAKWLVSTKNEQQLIPAFVSACEARLAGYDTTLEEDERLLLQEPLTPNERNCILMRRGEKRILQTYARSYAELARSGFLPTWLG